MEILIIKVYFKVLTEKLLETTYKQSISKNSNENAHLVILQILSPRKNYCIF